MDVIDYRSDTVTLPTTQMRRSMMDAELGDDVYGEDPTVNALQEEAATLCGKQAALFMPSGSMGNCVSLLALAEPGTEVVCEASSHIVNHELGALSVIGGLMPRALASERGWMSLDEIESRLRPMPYYCARVGVISVENTHNLAGGTVAPQGYLKDLADLASRYGVPVHMDGARVFNAAVASGLSVADIAQYCDTMMFCLSKGLCAPSGSLIVGSKDFIDKARILRKRLGGGMRQIGCLAAAGRIALTSMVDRLEEDHDKVSALAEVLLQFPCVQMERGEVRTNILFFRLSHSELTPRRLVDLLAERSIRCSVFGDGVRMVTHRDIRSEMVAHTSEVLREILTRFH